MENKELIVRTANTDSENQSGPMETTKAVKKIFVTPEISVPVDILEATTFFQAAESGVTN